FTKQPNGAIKYMLLHLSNHDEGRDFMKSCLWDIAPTGDFYIKKHDNPDQEFLFPQEPNLCELEDWNLAQLRVTDLKWLELVDRVRKEIWLETQLGKHVEKLVQKKILRVDGRFVRKKNQLLRLEQDTLL
ncbi:hypothetical protein K8I31_09545, partial [bacterium]|nr:hypothetical protein [bacterium]